MASNSIGGDDITHVTGQDDYINQINKNQLRAQRDDPMATKVHYEADLLLMA